MPTLDNYKDFLAVLRKQTGLEALTPDDTGLVSLRVQDEYNLNLQFVQPSGKIFCFVEVADLPKDAGREVYRELLAAGLFGLETAGGHFTLSTETETVVYDYLFDNPAPTRVLGILNAAPFLGILNATGHVAFTLRNDSELRCASPLFSSPACLLI